MSGIIYSSASNLVLMASVKSIVLLQMLVLLSSVAHGQAQTCHVTESWVRRAPFHASSNELVGKFPLIVGDEPIKKVFRHDETGLDISVGVEVFKGVFDGEPTRIRMVLLLGAKPEQVFDVSSEASEVMTVYDNHWRFLSVDRTVARNDRLYTFTFSCERPFRKRSH